MSITDPRTNGELRLAEELVPQSKIVFDVGARTDDLLPRLNSNCQFHLFEPIPSNFEQLMDRLAGEDNVFANQLALGSEAGSAHIYPDTESITLRPHSKANPIEIQIVRLDDYCAEKNVHHIDFLKIDVEGHELDVLIGGSSVIWNSTTSVQFEYGGTYRDVGIRLKDVFDFFGPKWNFYKISPADLEKIPKYSRLLEDYRYSNFVASRLNLSSIDIKYQWSIGALRRVIGL